MRLPVFFAALGCLALTSGSGGAADLGSDAARCRPNEAGPAILVDVTGLKDAAGVLRLELYPDDPHDFLTDDAKLIAAGKTFRRVVQATPPAGSGRLCIRAPAPGSYALVLIHDRDGKPAFSVWHDGVGVPANPAVLHGQPTVSQARIAVDSGVTPVAIRLLYLHGLLSFAPIAR